jgi:uncharacterized protein YndB with AHSA1/START domain
MTSTTDRITIDQFIGCPPEQVWPFITTPEALAAWWVPGDISPSVGHRFMLEMPGWGNVECEVLEVDEPRRLVYSFGAWTLTWSLVAEGHGTRLVLDHAGFDIAQPADRFALDDMGPGWRDDVLPRLAHLAEAS